VHPRSTTILVSVLVGALLLAALAVTPPARGGTFVSGRLVEEMGSTEILGGGDYLFVKFGEDAVFGVLWGNVTNPNHIHIVVLKARYLGVAEVVDANGRRIAENVPVKYWTLHAVKLLDLVEVRDLDGDNLGNYTRGFDGANFTSFAETDEVPKMVSLGTTWTRGPIQTAGDDTGRSWSFNLTAENLPYIGVNNAVTPRGDNVLNHVGFAFHLTAALEQVDNVTVPSWKITIDTAQLRPAVLGAERLGNVTRSGTVARYSLKWDQNITGWDFEAPGTRRLLLEFAAIVGNLIPPTAANWLNDRFVRDRNETGRARYETAGRNETVDNRTGNVSAPRPLRSPYVEFGGDWTRIGRFTWVTASTVDGTPAPLYAQILAGRGLVARGPYGGAFVGFVILGALSFAEGDEILHDPTVTTDAIAELLPVPTGNEGVFLAVAVVVAIVLVGVAAIVLSRKKKR